MRDRLLRIMPLVAAFILIGTTCDSADNISSRTGPRQLLNPPKRGDVWWMREGKGYTLCEALYKKLQDYTPEGLGQCAASVALSLPGMKELDGWKELNPREHGELFKRLLQYQQVGVEAYFHKSPEYSEYFEKKKYDDSWLEKKYQDSLEFNVRMRVKTMKVFRYPLGHPDLATYGQPQTVLEIRKGRFKEQCPKAPTLTDSVQTFYVAADLSGPAPDVLAGEAASGGSGRLVSYKGVIHLMLSGPGGGDGVGFYRDFGDGQLHPFCEIRRNPER